MQKHCEHQNHRLSSHFDIKDTQFVQQPPAGARPADMPETHRALKLLLD